MCRSLPIRLVALLVGLIAGLVTPGLAVAHGLAHDHLAHEHRPGGALHPLHDAAEAALADDHGGSHGGDDHDDRHTGAPHVADALVALSVPDHRHDHGHATIDLARVVRDLGRVDVAVHHAPPPVAPAASEIPLAHTPAVVDHALLARPDSAPGPPPRLRAPPIR